MLSGGPTETRSSVSIEYLVPRSAYEPGETLGDCEGLGHTWGCIPSCRSRVAGAIRRWGFEFKRGAGESSLDRVLAVYRGDMVQQQLVWGDRHTHSKMGARPGSWD